MKFCSYKMSLTCPPSMSFIGTIFEHTKLSLCCHPPQISPQSLWYCWHMFFFYADGNCGEERWLHWGRTEGNNVPPRRRLTSCFKWHHSPPEFLWTHTMSVWHLCQEFYPSIIVKLQRCEDRALYDAKLLLHLLCLPQTGSVYVVSVFERAQSEPPFLIVSATGGSGFVIICNILILNHPKRNVWGY